MTVLADYIRSPVSSKHHTQANTKHPTYYWISRFQLLELSQKIALINDSCIRAESVIIASIGPGVVEKNIQSWKIPFKLSVSLMYCRNWAHDQCRIKFFTWAITS